MYTDEDLYEYGLPMIEDKEELIGTYMDEGVITIYAKKKFPLPNYWSEIKVKWIINDEIQYVDY